MMIAFHIGPIPVRIHPWFLIFAVLMGFTAQSSPGDVALWAAALGATILLHELAHALVARAFGLPAVVELTLSVAANDPRIGSAPSARRIAVSLAGPLVNLIVGALLITVAHSHVSDSQTGAALLRSFARFNCAWGGLNLLPVLPLDGGYVLLAIGERLTRGRAEQPIRAMSVSFALAMAIGALIAHQALLALVFGLFALHNARGMRGRDAEQREMLARVHLDAAFDALERGEPRTGIQHCLTVLATSSVASIRSDAARLLAYAYATTDAWYALLSLLESCAGAIGDADLEKYERAARELGRVEVARRIAILRGGLAPEAA